MSARRKGRAYSTEQAHALLEDATSLLMVDHDIDEIYALEMLCGQAARSGRTVVETAAQVMAEAAASAPRDRVPTVD